MHFPADGTHNHQIGNSLWHLDGLVELKISEPLVTDQLILNSAPLHFLVLQASAESSSTAITQAMTGHVKAPWATRLINIHSQSWILITIHTVSFMVAIQCSLAWEPTNGLVSTQEVKM